MLVLGKRLCDLRKEKGLTQEALANRLGISKASISCYESGKKKPTYERLTEIAYVLEVDVNYFLGTNYQIKTNDGRTYSFSMVPTEAELLLELRKHTELYSKIMANPKRFILAVENNLKFK